LNAGVDGVSVGDVVSDRAAEVGARFLCGECRQQTLQVDTFWQGEVGGVVLDEGPDCRDVIGHVLLLDDSQKVVPKSAGKVGRDVLLLLLEDVEEAVPEGGGEVFWNILLNIRNPFLCCSYSLFKLLTAPNLRDYSCDSSQPIRHWQATF